VDSLTDFKSTHFEKMSTWSIIFNDADVSTDFRGHKIDAHNDLLELHLFRRSKWRCGY
jgi:hypothetical protein